MKGLPKYIWNAIKIAGCGAIIAAIAMGFAVLSPQGDVERADADIFWTGPGSLQDSKQERFIDFLDEEGFSEPQPYDWNGNIIYFSHGQTEESPREAAARLQKSFLRSGINERIFPVPPDPKALSDESSSSEEKAYSTLAMREFFTGGMIPVVDTGDQVAFTGVEVAAEGGNIDELSDMYRILGNLPSHVDTASIFNNARYVEVFRAEGHSRTQQIAVFGDEEMVMNRFQPGMGGAAEHRSPEEIVPACPGCERTSRLSGMESQESFEMQTFESPGTVDGVLDFYRRALVPRGWNISSGVDAVSHFDAFPKPFDLDRRGDMAVFVRGDNVVHIHAYRANDGGTHVSIFQGE